MATLLDTIQAAFDKAGVAKDSPEAAEFIKANSNLAGIASPEILVKVIDSFIPVDTAHKNPKVISALKADILDPLDNSLDARAEKLLSGDDLAAFKALGKRNTYEKERMLSDKIISDLETAKAKAARSGDTDAVKSLNEQLAEANRLAKEKDAQWEQKLKAKEEEVDNFMYSHNFAQRLSKYKIPEAYQKLPNVTKTFIEAHEVAAAKEGAIIRNTEGGLGLFLKDSPTTPLYDKVKNTAVSFDDFSERVMSNYVSTDPAPAPPAAEPKVHVGAQSNGQVKTWGSVKATV